MTAPGLIIAAPHSGAGKTTVTLAVLAALRRRSVRVRAAKAGPDYIDPAFHAAVTGAASVNLDSWAMPGDLLDSLAAQAARDADLHDAFRKAAGLGEQIALVDRAVFEPPEERKTALPGHGAPHRNRHRSGRQFCRERHHVRFGAAGAVKQQQRGVSCPGAGIELVMVERHGPWPIRPVGGL